MSCNTMWLEVLKIEAVCSSKMFVSTYKSICYNPEESINCQEKLRSDTVISLCILTTKNHVYYMDKIVYLLWVSLRVSVSSLNRSLRSASEKCLATSSSLSTTLELRAFLCACLWKIFSSIVPVCNRLHNDPE